MQQSHAPHQDPQHTLRVQHLSKKVTTVDGELTLLDDINLDVAQGETLAVVGASGSGKTTLLGLLAGLDRPTGGEIYWGTQPLGSLSEDQLAAGRQSHIGFVFQSFQLLPALTALDNVMLPLQLAGKPNPKQTALKWLDQVGLAARVSHTPRQLSGGEQQRVAIARAFVSEPQLVFADEPTGNLDTATGSSIVDLMFSLNTATRTTLVLVTHDASLAARCGRQIRLQAGRIV
jgi:putative ABC transport system ATP-binding protein